MATNWDQYLADNSASNDTDWEQYAAPKASQPESIIDKFPYLTKLALSMAKPVKQGASEKVQALGRGLTDIGEGSKQLALSAAEKFGLQPDGAADEYSNKVNAEREFYNKSPAGQDPLAQGLRSTVASAPFMAATGGPLGMEGGALAKMLLSGAGGGLTKGSEFVAPGESRAKNTAVGALEGASVPGLSEAPGALSKLGEKISPLFTKINPKELAYGVQAAHDKLLSQSSDIYNFIKDQVKQRGVSKIDIPDKVIDEAASTLPRTRAMKKLIDQAKTGDYEALHDLQSDLGKRGTKALGADLSADRNSGEEMLDTREKINEAIANRFKEYGHGDLSNLLDEARSKYRELKDTYYSHPTIGKLVHYESRKIPSNPMNVFSEESKPMSKLLNKHPEISKAVGTYNKSEEMKKSLKDLGIKGAIVGGNATLLGGSYKLSKSLLNLLNNSE